MSPHLHLPRLHRHLREGRKHVGLGLAFVLAIVALALFSSAAQVVDLAVSGPRVDVRVSQAAARALSEEDLSANSEVALIATSLVEVPSASVDAISL